MGQKKVLELLEESDMSNSEISNELELNLKTVNDYLMRLRRWKLIEMKRMEGRTKFWGLVKITTNI